MVPVRVSFVVVMTSWCAGRDRFVLDDWELLLGQPARRRYAGQLVEVPGEVGLVVVPGLGGDGGEIGCAGAPQPPPGPLEAEHPGVRLRRHADLDAEALGEVAAT